MADETPAAPEPTPAEQAASDAHTATNAEEQSWGGKIEQRLAAVEAHLGIGGAADTEATEADNAKETK